MRIVLAEGGRFHKSVTFAVPNRIDQVRVLEFDHPAKGISWDTSGYRPAFPHAKLASDESLPIRIGTCIRYASRDGLG